MGVSYSGGIAVKGGGLKTGLKPAPPPLAFDVTGIKLDGVTDRLVRGADLTGNADGPRGTYSIWIKMLSDQAGIGYITLNIGTHLNISRGQVAPTNAFQVSAINSNAAPGVKMKATTLLVPSEGWVNILASWDISVPEAHLYFNNVEDKTQDALAIPPAPVEVFYTSGGNWGLFGWPNGGEVLHAEVAEVYFNTTEFLDFSDPDERAKFIDPSTLKPVNLGADGSTPTTNSPIIYLTDGATGFVTNQGTGGNFSVVGSLADADSSPSD